MGWDTCSIGDSVMFESVLSVIGLRDSIGERVRDVIRGLVIMCVVCGYNVCVLVLGGVQ